MPAPRPSPSPKPSTVLRVLEPRSFSFSTRNLPISSMSAACWLRNSWMMNPFVVSSLSPVCAACFQKSDCSFRLVICSSLFLIRSSAICSLCLSKSFSAWAAFNLSAASSQARKTGSSCWLCVGVAVDDFG